MLTREQVDLINRWLGTIARYPDKRGELTIVVINGHPRYIIPQPHIDLPRPEQKTPGDDAGG